MDTEPRVLETLYTIDLLWPKGTWVGECGCSHADGIQVPRVSGPLRCTDAEQSNTGGLPSLGDFSEIIPLLLHYKFY